jgi:hypothetical protein
MAEYLKSQTPEELWKASLEPENPLKPKNATDSKLTADAIDPVKDVQAPKAEGTGLVLDVTA